MPIQSILILLLQTITLTDPATEIDLGGIVKGYASDQLIELFRRQGVSSAIVSLGGNIQTLGRKPDGSLWKVGIQNPFHPEACIGLVEIEEQAVITSGAYQRYFVGIDGKQYHHIIDSRTGAPPKAIWLLSLSSATAAFWPTVFQRLYLSWARNRLWNTGSSIPLNLTPFW